MIERYEDGRTVGDALAGPVVEEVAADGAGDAEPGAVPAVEDLPPGLVAEIEAAVVDLIEGSPRRVARRRRRVRARP
ncbi:MAG TPA: hypothetical protein VFZ77_09960 [Acidimicrobiales bacterium]